jgi:AcrR family transcriptional regulator
VASQARRRTGRRRGQSSTREAIAEAARRQFAELGFERATIRTIAAEAKVDSALVMHFFGSKQELFVSAMEFPFAPEDVLLLVFAGPRSEVGLRLARFVVGVLEDERARSVMTGIVRAAASRPEAADLARELVSGGFVRAMSQTLPAEDAPLRPNLLASQVIGLMMARYVVRAEPLASLPPEAVIDAVAGTFQRYLAGPLASAGGAAAPMA